MKVLKQADETESIESTDTPEHRRRGVSQSGSVEPTTSLISNDMLLPRDTEEEERDDHADPEETGDQSDSTQRKEETDNGGNNKDPGRQNVTQLPGLFDEDDPESNELFGSTS